MGENFYALNKKTSEFYGSDFGNFQNTENIPNDKDPQSDEKNTTIKEQKKLKMTLLDPSDVVCCQKILEANALI